MDITRNWRLKSSRSHLLATRCPTTGAVILPQQSTAAHQAAQSLDVYTFEVEAAAAPVIEDDVEYARAAR